MTNKADNINRDTNASTSPNGAGGKSTLLRLAGWLGLLIAAPFFLWVPLGFTGLVPPMIDVFGVVGLRIPAGATIAGLLLAAIGFHEV
ncbi:MAG: hypothetical protein ACI8Z1_003528 [Candidatus Azotimanducaceae bacterium]|jgi:hypothetical protein